MGTLGESIDYLHTLKAEKRQKEEEVKNINQKIGEAEKQLMDKMDAEGVSKSTGVSATASIGESVKPNVEDWDKFYEYIHRYRYFHLLERRPSVTGCRELFEMKGNIPGVVPFTHRKVNVRTI